MYVRLQKNSGTMRKCDDGNKEYSKMHGAKVLLA